MTASSLMAKGSLVAPFDLSVPALDSFYVVCRREAKAAPIVGVFIDWLFAARDEADARAGVPATARRARRPGQAPASAERSGKKGRAWGGEGGGEDREVT